jgi:hypothetical protein
MAIDSLPPSVIKDLDPARTGRKDVAFAALKAAQDGHKLSLKKRWRIKRPGGGEDIILRDVLEEVITWIRRFREVGDAAMQYDPGHVALPWAAIRFLLQAAISETDVHAAMVEDLETVAGIMARSRHIEKLFLSKHSGVNSDLSNALVAAYASILELFAKAVRFFCDSSAVRVFKAPFSTVDESSRINILTKEAEVLKQASLIDAERLVNVEAHVLRLADLSVASQKEVEDNRYLDVLRWLSRVEYSRHHASHRGMRVQGTGEWLLQHPEFRSWTMASSSSLLLVHGIPGCSKTILCSAVIDKYLRDISDAPNTAPLAYFYCNASGSGTERRSADGVIRSLTRQLTVSKLPQSIHTKTLALYNRLADEAKLDGFEIMKASIADRVELILAALEDNPATLIIDALDEVV